MPVRTRCARLFTPAPLMALGALSAATGCGSASGSGIAPNAEGTGGVGPTSSDGTTATVAGTGSGASSGTATPQGGPPALAGGSGGLGLDGSAGARAGASAGTQASSGGGSSTGQAVAVATPRVDNPYAGGVGYVNPEWRQKALLEPGGERVADTPTAVWLDRIAAIGGTPDSQSNGPKGLRDHLDAALAQGADYIQVVIYDLPGRDCAALASNGELGPDDLPRYEGEYIDPIAEIMGDPAYAALRIINIIEVDSLPNLVTNLDIPACATMKDNGGYVRGIAYALKALGALLSFAQAFREKLVEVGFDPAIGMLIDTSRNGWGGSARPTGPSSSTDVEIFVDDSRVDRRIHAGNCFNQAGAGLGERPRTEPETGIDAYVWIKPPGESDGSSSEIPNSDGKGFDRMCDPTYGGNELNGNNATGALPDASISGAWFPAQFQELMANAHPPL